MKKSLIATSVSAIALAAIPMAGVFAAESGTITDNLTVNIPASCTVTNTVNPQAPTDGSAQALTNEYVVEMKNGQLRSDIGSAAGDAKSGTTADGTINVSCNTPTGDDTTASTWNLTAIGAGTEGYEDKLHGTAGDIATGTETSGNNSQWAFKVTKGAADNVNYAGTYAGAFTAVPKTTEMSVISGRGNASAAFTMTYQVYISQTQATGEYKGAVKYTLYNPAQ